MMDSIRHEETVSLRRASKYDQPRIRQLVRGEHLNPMGLDWRHFWLAESSQGEVIGCGQVKPHSDGSRELASLVVVPSWRRQGVAAALIERLEDEAGAPLWLTCRSVLVPFYEQFAFAEITDDRQLTPYFSRLRRAAKVFFMLARAQEHLAIMLWEGHPGAAGGGPKV
jgi:N-acetylglutamate synthase-like GNAT family acetyltransferase